MIRIHDLSTDTVVDREMNDSEFAQYEVDQVAEASRIAEEKTKATARAALLTQLGITEEQAKLLLG